MESIRLESVGVESVGVESVGVESVGVESVGVESVGVESVGVESVGVKSFGVESFGVESFGVESVIVSCASQSAGGEVSPTTGARSGSAFAGWLVSKFNPINLLPAIPYSASFIRQDQMPVGERAVTRTEAQRMLCLRGDDGAFVCRLADGWSTVPNLKDEGRMTFASRSILRLNNIALFRHRPVDGDLRTSMVGPNHYFGVLDSIHTHALTLRYTDAGMPYFVKEPRAPEQSLPQTPIPECFRFTCDSALWLSGKIKDNRQYISDHATTVPPGKSLTKDVGVLLFGTDDEVISLPQFDARSYDLSPFGATLVRNDRPFRITDAAEDPMDVVTYHFGPDYAKTLVQQGAGLFLETHDFTQIMSPVTKDSGGFITLGRWQQGRLELVAVSVPYGHSIIVEKGAIHGDATFCGSYLMAMTVNHHTMATADVVLLKNRAQKNMQLTQSREPEKASSLDRRAPRFTDHDIKPLVVSAAGPLKQSFDNDIKKEKAPLDRATRTGNSVVYYPIHSGYQRLMAL